MQVIGQQWNWTYRYPSFGGVETPQLELPVDQDMELHVTSLDVIHSFWARQLGVKADAIPGVDNIAYVRPTKVRELRHPLRRAVRPLPRAHVPDRAGRQRRPASRPGSSGSSACSRRRPRTSTPIARSYLPDPERRAG